MDTHMPSLRDLPRTHPTPLGHHRELNWAPCATEQAPPAPCYTHGRTYVSPNLPFIPLPLGPHVCALHLRLYLYPPNKFICAIFLDPTYMH